MLTDRCPLEAIDAYEGVKAQLKEQIDTAYRQLTRAAGDRASKAYSTACIRYHGLLCAEQWVRRFADDIQSKLEET